MWVQRILTILERPSLCLSDHCCVEFSVLVDFACDASIFSSYRYYSWRRADYIGINNYSQNLTGLNFFATSQVLLICGLPLLVLFFYAVTVYVPTKVPRNCVPSQKHVNRLYPREVRKAFAKKLQYWRKYKANPDNYTLKLKYQ